MSSDKRIGTQVPKNMQSNKAPAARIDPGPYIGVVKNVLDASRAGRMSVYIPELGGKPDDPRSWKTVSYASPFAGSTYQDTMGSKGSKENYFSIVSQTYGFWAVPPDIGNQVLCTFVMGDPDRGYWFGCVFDRFGHNMVPGIGGGPVSQIDTATIQDGTLKAVVGKLGGDAQLPMSEANEANPANAGENFYYRKRTLHEYQAKVYINQGLDRDPVRGAVATSSQRDIPGSVYGWSTPGRPVVDQSTNNLIQQKLDAGTYNDLNMAQGGRRGGHSFVMDDGDHTGQSQMIRLRTAGGHQILMNDTERTLYIANSEGSCWVELAGSGQMHIYNAAGFNIRSGGDINMHSDGSINIAAVKDFNVKASGKMFIEAPEINQSAKTLASFASKYDIVSDGTVTLFAKNTIGLKADQKITQHAETVSLNEGPKPKGGSVPGLAMNTHDDTVWDPGRGMWQVKGGYTNSIVRVLPTHEPWTRQSGYAQGGNSGSRTSVNAGFAPRSNTATYTNPSSGLAGVQQGRGTSLPRSKLPPAGAMTSPKAPSPSKAVGSLTQQETKAYMTAMAHRESRAFDAGSKDYATVNQYGYSGRYQFGAAALADEKYIKLEYYQKYGNAALDMPQAWTGKDGVTSRDAWLSSPGTQEKAMVNLTQKNYNTLVSNGVIKSGDDPSHVAGMLATAHLLGAGGATTWSRSGVGKDANGTSGGSYYASGVYAVDVMSKQ